MATRIRGFGRYMFALYEKRPLLMNSCAGGTVYISSEIIVQLQNKQKDKTMFESIDKTKVSEIGALGVLENGILMSWWYTFLNRVAGSGVTTYIVILKCLLDQIFFATQQDLLFLGLCAVHNDPQKLPQAIDYVKNTFLTTWIMDCSLWPIVNFFGFLAVPIALQPSYMAVVQCFWQVYMSSLTVNSVSKVTDEERQLAIIFDEIDEDKNGYLDGKELSIALAARGIIVKNEDIIAMIEEGDSEEEHDGRISFDEFKILAKKEKNALWNSLTKKNALSKGIRATMTKLRSLKSNESDSKVDSKVDDIVNDFDPAIIQRRKERSDAVTNATISFSVLTTFAVMRKLIFKI